MASNEATFDLYISGLLDEAGIEHDAQGSSVKDISAALKTASKNQDGNIGKPEYTAVVGEYIIVVEDKKDRDKLILREPDEAIALTPEATVNYAVNGALFYAQKILEVKSSAKIFAVGCAGDAKHCKA